MSDRTTIEWTQASWNPTVGCTKVTPGCDHCYAERLTNRFRGAGAFDTVVLRPERLQQPMLWKRPRRIFVNSMSDLFHTDVPDDYIADVFGVMAHAERHTFQVLTKRHARMRALLASPAFRDAVLDRVLRGDRSARDRFIASRWPLRNVWLGVSVEDQQRADLRIPTLLDTPAAVRFLSCEPLLGPVDLWRSVCGHRFGNTEAFPCCESQVRRLGWVIAGGESGPGARAMRADWARSLRDECAAARVPFFMKQAGVVLAREWGCKDRTGHDPADWPEPFPREYPHAA